MRSDRRKFTSLTRGTFTMKDGNDRRTFAAFVFCSCNQLNSYGKIIDRQAVLDAMKGAESVSFKTPEMAAEHIARKITDTRKVEVRVRLTEPDGLHSVEASETKVWGD